jgi:hypothetical protein
MTSTTQKIYAHYHLTSVFEIPSDATDWSIHWDKISYTRADGTDVEDEGPVQDCQEDHEVYHRPTDEYVEDAKDDSEKVPDEFLKWAEQQSQEDIIEMLWSYMSHKDRRNIIKEVEDEETEEEVKPTTVCISCKTNRGDLFPTANPSGAFICGTCSD